MSAEYNLGLFIGILVGLAIVAVFFFVTGKKKMWVYDERQKLARAQAFKWAYITLIGGGFACLLTYTGYILSPDWVMNLLVISMITSAAVFACICIHKEAWMALNERPKAVLGVCVLGLVGNLILPIGDLFVEGMMPNTGLNLAVGGMMAVILINYGIHRLILRRENDEESAS